jgi:hypothetical protein
MDQEMDSAFNRQKSQPKDEQIPSGLVRREDLNYCSPHTLIG